MDLIEKTKHWIFGDPDVSTQGELQALLDGGAIDELRERMSADLEFGTAGLRGVVGAGTNRMNRAVILRTTFGLSQYLLNRVSDAKARPVIVGYDARLTSEEFAEATVKVLTEAGLRVEYFSMPVPTPVVGFAAKLRGACAAVVITASHNPPEYNGYKVYAPNAVQIVPPIDGEIAAAIEQAPQAKDVPVSAFSFRTGHPNASPVPDAILEQYFEQMLAIRPAVRADASLRIVYTPLHGVGWRFAEQAFLRAGYRATTVVPEQSEPDGRFPTVRFPNPEEPGAMDLAFALAQKTSAELVVANDPDADRLAIAVPNGSGFLQLTGNQVGVLLADFLLERAPAKPQPLVVQSLVSSPMLASIAKAYGARYERTLTGFKWIWNAALDLERDEGVRFCFGYEEALGYSVGPLVRDKCGISVAVVFADLVSHLKASGQTVLGRLHELYRKHGLYISYQRSVLLEGTQGMAKRARAMERLASSPPPQVSGKRVTQTTNYEVGEEERPRWLHNTSMFELELEGGTRVLVRPSGTEPKLKIYVDLRVPVAQGEDLQALEKAAEAQARDIATPMEAFLLEA